MPGANRKKSHHSKGKTPKRKSLQRPSKKRRPIPVFIHKQLPKGLQLKKREQAQPNKAKIQAARAAKAFNRFRARKGDRDSFVFVEKSGKRDTQKGRKGYLIYVGKRGKKYLVKDVKDGFRAKQKSKLIPKESEHRGAFKKLQARRIQTRDGLPVIKGSGKIKVSGSKWDFNTRIVNKFANGVTKVVNSQAAFRDFTIRAMILVEKPDGSTKVYSVDVVLQKQGNVKIPTEHILNFLRQQFYAVFAQQLAYDGYVTSGSANHVRGLSENKGKEQDEWTKNGLPWQGRHDTEFVKIKLIEWQAIQNR